MANVLLIEPADKRPHVFSLFKIPRLGNPLLGTILQNNGHNVEVHVEGISRKPTIHPDIVGISTITPTANRAYQIADRYREQGIPVMIGGSHVSALPNEALQHADYVCVGEGESVIEAMVEGKLPKGIIYGTPVENLDDLPHVNLGLIKPRRNLLTFIQNSLHINPLPISTSRGCPNNCKFCSVWQMFGRNYRFQSPARVSEELAELPRHQKVFFCDDNLALRTDRTFEICEEMIRQNERNGKRNWSAQVEVNIGKKPELLKLMARSGCTALYIGFESINPRSLKEYGKRQTLEDMDKCVEELRKAGIHLHAMFILGADTDYYETIRETYNYCISRKIPTMQLMILVPLPGTKTTENLEKEGRILSYNWDLYTGHHAVFKPANMTAEELERETMRTMRRFYSPIKGIENILNLKPHNAFITLVGSYLTRKWQRACQ